MENVKQIQLEIWGEASNQKIGQLIWSQSSKLDLLTLFQKHKLPIASSCGGEGQCQKCTVILNIGIIKTQVISCLTSFTEVNELLEKHGINNNLCRVLISYL